MTTLTVIAPASSSFASGSHRRPTRIPMLRALALSSVAAMGICYLFAWFFVPFILKGGLASGQAMIAVVLCCTALLWAAGARKMEPALWGMGYVVGFIAVTFVTDYVADSNFLRAAYAGAGILLGLCAMVGNLMAHFDLSLKRVGS